MFLQNAARTYGTIVGEFLPTVLWVYPTHGTVGVYGIHPQYTPTEVRIPSVYTVYTLGILYTHTVYYRILHGTRIWRTPDGMLYGYIIRIAHTLWIICERGGKWGMCVSASVGST